jgi:ATP-dependent DNA helicase RecG
MADFDPHAKVQKLLSLGRETEWLECKTAGNNYNFENLGKYFSALSNEANLHNRDAGWLIFGVANDGSIVGTNYRATLDSLDSLKHEIAEHVSNGLTFPNIFDVVIDDKRVLLFKIPPAMRGMPTAWKGHYYGRDGESLAALSIQKMETIRGQAIREDFTATICKSASLDDLQPEAILEARTQFMQKNPKLLEEAPLWSDEKFLNKAKITINGQITRAAILLLGKPEAEHFLSPAVGTITWILKDKENMELDYQHFGPPWILNARAVYSKVRNLRYRHMPDGTLFPLEIDQYDEWVFREALHNCIAHQDYSLGRRITLVEFPDRLLFSNAGSFIPESIERVIERDAPEDSYRNPFLAASMVNLNMIDTIGSGIKRMYITQRERFFPLPEYEFSQNNVSVSIMGRILDTNYVQQLSSGQDLTLHEVMLLDKVQKGIEITRESASSLRKHNLVEGRYPRLHISAQVAVLSKQKAKYLHNRGLDEDYYAKLVLDHIAQFGAITRQEADDLLFPKLSSLLNSKQKKNKVARILSIVLKGRIKNTGTRIKPCYIIFNSDNKK